jgi:ferritin-like metal-binding protein YciE
MPQMNDARALFIHELRDVLYAERQLEKTLPKLANEATDPELSEGFIDHRDQTRGHIERLKGAFESLGEHARAAQCPGIEGLTQEHDEFVSEQEASPEVLDQFLTGAGARAEHYEIAAYTGLVTMARALGERAAADLLAENLREEQAMLERLETVAERLAAGSPRA